jgi:hypothetical protein
VLHLTRVSLIISYIQLIKTNTVFYFGAGFSNLSFLKLTISPENMQELLIMKCSMGKNTSL